MLAAPCAIALRSSNRSDEPDAMELELAEAELREYPTHPAPFAAGLPNPLDHALSLTELALRAEADARTAQELAREAHCAALAATAHAARLRAEAALEAADYAHREAAIFNLEYLPTHYLPPDHPSLDFPRSRARRAA